VGVVEVFSLQYTSCFQVNKCVIWREEKKSDRFRIIEKDYDTYSVPEYRMQIADTVFLPAKIQENGRDFFVWP
jgi:hypothetical protein